MSTCKIAVYEIRYLEVRQNYVTIHADEDYTMKKPLRELEKQLDELDTDLSTVDTVIKTGNKMTDAHVPVALTTAELDLCIIIGTHDELVAQRNGKYHELWHAQARYYA